MKLFCFALTLAALAIISNVEAQDQKKVVLEFPSKNRKRILNDTDTELSQLPSPQPPVESQVDSPAALPLVDTAVESEPFPLVESLALLPPLVASAALQLVEIEPGKPLAAPPLVALAPSVESTPEPSAVGAEQPVAAPATEPSAVGPKQLVAAPATEPGAEQLVAAPATESEKLVAASSMQCSLVRSNDGLERVTNNLANWILTCHDIAPLLKSVYFLEDSECKVLDGVRECSVGI